MKKVLKFSASWCQPCKMLAAYLKDVKTEIEIVNIDIDEDSTKAVQYGVRGVPTLIMVEDEKEIKRTSGVKNTKELEEWINND